MCVLYFFYGFLFFAGSNFFKKATNGRPYFFDRPFCSSKERWRCVSGLSSCTLRGDGLQLVLSDGHERGFNPWMYLAQLTP